MIAYKQRVIDMDKLTMAHDYAMKHVQEGFDINYDVLVVEAWKYADAMQAEADKRKPKPELPSLQQTFINGVEQPRYAPSLDEWQPDWSQAPDGFNRFVICSVGGHGFFTNIEPKLMGDYYYIGGDGVVFHNHGYQGNWQDSLRKRPHGE